MQAPLSLVLFGFAAMLGPMLGASMPWAPAVHALVFGAETAWWWHGAPHVLPAYAAAMAGMVIAWVGTVWACALAALHERRHRDDPERWDDWLGGAGNGMGRAR